MAKELDARQRAFCEYFIECNSPKEAAIKAGYPESQAGSIAKKLLKNKDVANNINSFRKELQRSSIASAQEVMEYFTKVMNGEIKDQFGLDAPLSERTRAATELAKRTVDVENRLQGKADSVVEIKLDWSRE